MINVFNFKSYESKEKVIDFLQKLTADPDFSSNDYYVALPFYFLLEIGEKFSHTNLIFGLNSMNTVLPSSFTEEVAVDMLREVNAQFVLIGTFESRSLIDESDESINRKIVKALSFGITPFLCFDDINVAKLKDNLKKVTVKQLKNFTLIYESKWLTQSIFKPTINEIIKSWSSIRKEINSIFGNKTGPAINLIFPYSSDFEEDKSLLKKVGGDGFYFCSNGFFTINKIHNLAISKKLSAFQLEQKKRDKTVVIKSIEEKTAKKVEVEKDVVETEEREKKTIKIANISHYTKKSGSQKK